METEKLKQSYKNQLVRAGVDSHKAEQAVKNLTREELQLIREIWSEWAVVLTENHLWHPPDANVLRDYSAGFLTSLYGSVTKKRDK